MAEPTAKFPIRRYQQGRAEDADDLVVVEEPLEIHLQGEPFQVLMRLPGLEKELALGFLFTEGIVQSLSEVITMHFCGTGADPLLPPNVVDVTLTEAALARRGRRHLEVSYSSCGLCAKEAVSELVRQVPAVQSHLTVAPEALCAWMERLQEAQTLYRETGGTHGVALAAPAGDFFFHAEDVGRHNAMDKVIGRCLMRNRDMTQTGSPAQRPHQLRDGPEGRPGRRSHPGGGLGPHLHGPGTGARAEPHPGGLRPGPAAECLYPSGADQIL